MQRRQLQTGLIALALLFTLHLVDLLRADTWVLGEGDLDPIAGGRCLCQENLRRIELATRQWMLDEHKPLDAVPTWDDLAGPGRPLAAAPACPSGGVYTLASPAGFPSCSLAGTWPLSHVYTDTPCTTPDDERAREVICRENLERIHLAKEKWRSDKRLPHPQNPAWDDLVGADKFLKSSPVCPSGGTYSINGSRSFPACSLGIPAIVYPPPDYLGHSLYDTQSDVRSVSGMRQSCQYNLRRIDEAKLLVSWEQNEPPGSTTGWDDIVGSYRWILTLPECPAGGTYTLNVFSMLPSCSLTGTQPHDHAFTPTPILLSPRDQRCFCQQSLRDIATATERWIIDQRKSRDDVPTWTDLVGPMKYLRLSPVCPSGGVYTLAPASEKATCSLAIQAAFPHEFSFQPCLGTDGTTERERRCQCQENLRKIDRAKLDWAAEFAMPGSAIPTREDLEAQSEGELAGLACPAGGVYTIGAIETLPSCSLADQQPYLHAYSGQECTWIGETLRAALLTNRNTCRANLLDLQVATELWRADNQASDEVVPAWNDLVGTGKYLRISPFCPEGGVYTLQPKGMDHRICSRWDVADFAHYPLMSGWDCVPPSFHFHLTQLRYDSLRRAEQCRANLLRIDAAKQQCAKDTGAASDATPTMWDLRGCTPYLNMGNSSTLFCPEAGSYTVGPVSQPPRCSLHDQATFPHRIDSSYDAYDWETLLPRTIERLRRDDCVANLLAYKEATTRWAADTSAAPDAVPTLAELMPYIRYERLCPTGGVYTLAPPGTDPGCSRQDLALFPHVLPAAP
jgi:rRNA maturation protein Nop10